ncbi:CoA transferase [Cryobacterium sp. Y57]|uniref:CoA transferase n=1 Tax=Cryobacterium sp. Y57 TaxID=2048287 RepID=UPI000CE39D14
MRGGTCQIVDVSLVESCFSLRESTVPDYSATQYVAQASGSKLTGIALSNIYPPFDEKWVVIAANQNSVFARLPAAMQQTELVTDPRFVDHAARGPPPLNNRHHHCAGHEWRVVASEMGCGSAPTRWRFLTRNGSIAAGSTTTLVVDTRPDETCTVSRSTDSNAFLRRDHIDRHPHHPAPRAA